MDAKAKKLIDMVLKTEGNYNKIDGDTGGETYRGIARNHNPSWEGWKIVDKHKPLRYNQKINDPVLENMVRDFYYKKFYLPMKIDKINYLLTAGHVFCMGVNAGQKASIKLLQKAINKVCKVKISVDGIIGNQTLQYTNGKDKIAIANELIEQRNAYYKAIVARKPSQKKFLNGWLNRVKNTTKECSSKNVLLTSVNSPNKSTLQKTLSFIFDVFNLFKK